MTQEPSAAPNPSRLVLAAMALVALVAIAVLAACGLSDIFGKKATATVPAALLETPADTATPAPATPTPTAAATEVTSVSTATTEAQPAATATTSTASGAASGQSSYTVVQGDTLSGIAEQFGLTTAELVAANAGINPDALSIGQAIVIPVAGAAVATTPVVMPTLDQSGSTSGGAVQLEYAEAIQFEALSGWMQSLTPMVTMLATNPASICTSPEFDASLQQGQELQVGVGSAAPPPEMAALQAQLQSGLQGINDGLAAAKASMCESNDSAGAMASLLQVSISLAQVQSTLDSIGAFIRQGTGG